MSAVADRRRSRNLGFAVVAVWFLVVAPAHPVSASWVVSGGAGGARARAVSLASGPTPTASAAFSTITVSWPQASIPGFGPVQGYQLTRYNSGGTAFAPASNCNGVVTALSCVESGVGAGTWTYSVQPAQGSWRGAEGTRSNAVTTPAPDTTPPVVSAGALVKAAGGDGNVIRQGGTYYLYANASDVGSPASGVASVTANASTITTSATAANLVSGSYVVNGINYTYRSALLTANATLSEGARVISFTAVDGSGNSGSLNGHSVMIDNTAPATVDVQATNGGVVGKADSGDQVIYTYSETIDAQSVMSGWTGASTTVTVRLVDNGAGDRIDVYDATNTTLSKLGGVRLGSTNYVTTTITFTGSTIVRSGSTITVTLGTTTGSAGTVTTTGTMRWTPVAGVTDFGGNALPTTARDETGTADIDL